MPVERLPKIRRRIMADLSEIDHMAVFLRAIADDAGVTSFVSFDIDAEEEAVFSPKVSVPHGLSRRIVVVQQRRRPMQRAQVPIGDCGGAAHESDLVERLSG